MPRATIVAASLLCALLDPLALARVARAIPVPHMDHVIVVVMENKSYDQARVLPYTASLIAQSSSFSQSFALAHPSQPNYFTLWAASTLNISNDNCPPAGSPFFNDNLGHQCEVVGLTWKAYSEDLPAPGFAGCTSGPSPFPYTRKHDPWVSFVNLNHSNEVPYTQLAIDIANNALPNLAFVIPNNCNNTHDCPLATGDTWLANNLPAMINAVGPNGLVILTWDEDDFTPANRILTVFAGPLVKANFVSNVTVNHYNMVRTICQGLGLGIFANAVFRADITDVWLEATPARTSTWGQLKVLCR